MHPCRDHSPEGIARMEERRFRRRVVRWSIRVNGLRRNLMRALGYETPHTVPIYHALARRAWR